MYLCYVRTVSKGNCIAYLSPLKVLLHCFSRFLQCRCMGGCRGHRRIVKRIQQRKCIVRKKCEFKSIRTNGVIDGLNRHLKCRTVIKIWRFLAENKERTTYWLLIALYNGHGVGQFDGDWFFVDVQKVRVCYEWLNHEILPCVMGKNFLCTKVNISSTKLQCLPNGCCWDYRKPSRGLIVYGFVNYV